MCAPDSSQGLEGVRQLLEPWLRELAGARFSGEIPISEAQLNRFVNDRIRGSDGALESVRVHLLPGGEAEVRLLLRRPRFIPPVTITVRIREQPALPESPAFVLQWSLPRMGALAALVGPAAGLFDVLPRGIVAGGDRVTVNIAHLLREHGGGDLLTNVTALRVDTSDRMLVVNFTLHVRDRP